MPAVKVNSMYIMITSSKQDTEGEGQGGSLTCTYMMM